jgi:hypothetical protein
MAGMAVRPFGRLPTSTSLRCRGHRVGAGAGGEPTMEIHGAIAILTVVTAVIAAWLS